MDPQPALTPPDFTNPDVLIEAQHALEEEMTSTGIARYRKTIDQARQKGRESTTGYGNYLLQSWVLPLAKALEAFLAESAIVKAGRKHNAVKFLRMAKPEECAYIACKSILDTLTSGSRFQDVLVGIGAMIEDNVRFVAFKKAKPGLFKVISDGIGTDHYRHRKAVLSARMVHYGVAWESWSAKDRAVVGGKMVDLFIQVVPDAVETVTVQTNARKHKKTFLKLKPAMEKRIAEWIAKSEYMTPAFTPMVVPPMAWSHFTGGGYLGGSGIQRGIVKIRQYGAARGYVDEWNQKGEQLESVYAAINAIQEVPFQVNKAVFNVVNEAWDNGLDLASLPVRDALPLPARPGDISTDKTALTIWKRKASEVYNINRKLASKRLLTSRLLQVARAFEKYPTIYFPHQFDFRGRLYAVPMFLQPQGCDLAKGLLRFATGKPLGTQQAADWLAIHGANLFGFDKVSFKERIHWVLTHTQEILLSAMKPLEYRWWAKADDPWQFLAFCFEWRGYMKEKLAFVSHLPIALDGSCNGLQHFSALLRDPIGGKAVNLLPSDAPMDIYQAVADKVIEILKGHPSPFASRWLAFGIDRKMTKRPVMVVPYGGTKFSCREYIRQHVKDVVATNPTIQMPFEPNELQKATTFLSSVVWDSIGLVVVSAREAMAYLQKIARLLAKEDLPVAWTAPSGFPVFQRYSKRDCLGVVFGVANRKVELWIARDTEHLDRKRQERGISPNFVHSLDASALVFTVTSALASGVSTFAMIHDSYATHACDTEVLAQCCRIAFVEHVYAKDVLGDFTKEVIQMLPDDAELPEVPASGSLDIKAVLDSPFFFA